MPDRGTYKVNGLRISKLRGDLSAQEFITKCGISIETLKNLEAGGYAIQKTLEKIAGKHHGITWQELTDYPSGELPPNELPSIPVPRGLVTPTDFYSVEELAHAQQVLKGLQETVGRPIKFVLLAAFDTNSTQIDVALDFHDAFLIDFLFGEGKIPFLTSIIHLSPTLYQLPTTQDSYFAEIKQLAQLGTNPENPTLYAETMDLLERGLHRPNLAFK